MEMTTTPRVVRARWVAGTVSSRLGPKWASHVWACYFVAHLTGNGRKHRMIGLVGEFTREALGSVLP